MFYVRVDGIEESILNFLGYYKLDEDDYHELWQDYQGETCLVAKNGPRYMSIDDINDAMELSRKSDHPGIVRMP